MARSLGSGKPLIQPLGNNRDWKKNSQPKMGLCEDPFEGLKNIMESPLGKDLVIRFEKQVSLELKSFIL